MEDDLNKNKNGRQHNNFFEKLEYQPQKKGKMTYKKKEKKKTSWG